MKKRNKKEKQKEWINKQRKSKYWKIKVKKKNEEWMKAK